MWKKVPSLLPHNWPIIRVELCRLEHCILLWDKLVTIVVIHTTVGFNLQCNNVARQVEQKCCPCYRTSRWMVQIQTFLKAYNPKNYGVWGSLKVLLLVREYGNPLLFQILSSLDISSLFWVPFRRYYLRRVLHKKYTLLSLHQAHDQIHWQS